MRVRLKMSISILLALIFVSCGGANLNPILSGFSDSTSVLEESVSDIFDEMQSLEIEVKGEESIIKGSVSPEDFIPVIFTESVASKRGLLMRTLTEYSESLLLIFEGKEKDIYRNMELIKKSIKNISDRNPDFFVAREKGILFAVLTAVPKALTIAKRRRFAVKTMKNMQKVIEKISSNLIDEIRSSLHVSDNFFSRLFKERVAKNWPEKKTRRGRYSIMAIKLVKKRYLLKRKIFSLIKALELFPKAHKAIIGSVIKKRGTVSEIRDFAEYVYRMKKYWRSLTGEG